MRNYTPGPDDDGLIAVVDWHTGQLLWPPIEEAMTDDTQNPKPVMRIWHANLGGRKFIASVLALVAEHHALFEKLITSGDYKVLVLGTVGAYITGNVIQKRSVP